MAAPRKFLSAGAVFLLLAGAAVVVVAGVAEPDCSGVVMQMASCVSYISEGSKEAKPSSDCCAAVSSVVGVSPSCLFTALDMAPSMGIDVNITRAGALTDDCHVEVHDLPCRAPTPAPVIPSTPPPAAPSKPSPAPVQPPKPIPAPAQPPSPDCSSVIMDMASCISFISDDSKETKPSGDCCTSVSSVVGVSPSCLCAALEMAPLMGIVVNFTRAGALTDDCHVEVHDLPCNAPAPAPAKPSTPPPAAPSKPIPAPAQPPKPIPAPAPSPDCSSVIMDMASCISYISDDSKETKPSSDCCTAVSSVVGVSPSCLCSALEMAPSMGIDVNFTRAGALTDDCHVEVHNLPCSAPAPAPAKPSTPPPATPSKPIPAPAQPPKPIPAPANPPSPDCSSVIIDMASCISYITDDSKEAKPSGDCCTAVSSVVGVSPSCLCSALEMAPSMGVDVNMTRAGALTDDCHVKVHDLPCSAPTPAPTKPFKPSPPPPAQSPPSPASPAPSSDLPTADAPSPTSTAAMELREYLTALAAGGLAVAAAAFGIV